MLDKLALEVSTANPTLIGIVYTAALSFVLSTLIAVTYEKTFRGLSYSRNFVQSLILVSIVAATVMQAIGDSLATGLGMMGAMAIIRFRTCIKDPKDIVFMFASLASGIACGVRGYDIAVVGAAGFCISALLLYCSPFGQTGYFDGMVRFNIDHGDEGKHRLERILKQYCKTFSLVTLRDMAQGNRLDYAYQIKLKHPSKKDEFIRSLKEIQTIKGVSLMMQEATVEL